MSNNRPNNQSYASYFGGQIQQYSTFIANNIKSSLTKVQDYCDKSFGKMFGSNYQNNPYYRETKKGICSGSGTAIILFPVDKLSICYNLYPEKKLSFLDILKMAARRPAYGLIPAVISGSSKHTYTFTTKRKFESWGLSVSVSSSLSGLTQPYVGCPLAFIKVRRVAETSIKDLRNCQLKDFASGVHAVAVRESQKSCVFFTLDKKLKPNPDEENNFTIQDPLVRGFVSNTIAAAVSKPAATIADKAKLEKVVSVKDTLNLTKRIFKSSGFRGFYNGFWQTNLLRMGIQGVVINGAVHYVDQMNQRSFDQQTIEDAPERNFTKL